MILIPESDIPPHQSIKEHRFYMRGGGNLYKPCVTQIENLFYKKLSPVLEFIIEATDKVERCLDNRSFQTRNYLFGIKNSGRIVAKFPMIELNFNRNVGLIDDFGVDEIGADRNGHHGLIRQFPIRCMPEKDHFAKTERFVGDISHVVYPNDTKWISIIKVKFHFEEKSVFELNYKIYAENFVGKSGIARVSGKNIEYFPEE